MINTLNKFYNVISSNNMTEREIIISLLSKLQLL